MLAAIEARWRLASNFPLTLAAPASDAFHRILPRGRRNDRREFAARQLAFLEIARRSEAIADASRLVGPHHRFLLAGELERVAPAAAVAFVDLLPDLGADHGAEHRADCRAIAPALDDAVVLVPLLAGVADIVWVVFLAPAVGRCPGRWVS